jgi:hypothetical protein
MRKKVFLKWMGQKSGELPARTPEKAEKKLNLPRPSSMPPPPLYVFRDGIFRRNGQCMEGLTDWETERNVFVPDVKNRELTSLAEDSEFPEYPRDTDDGGIDLFGTSNGEWNWNWLVPVGGAIGWIIALLEFIFWRSISE